MGCKSFQYSGGKGASGTYQKIINAIPQHSVFIEAFAGSAKITLHKKPAFTTHLFELNPAVFAKLKDVFKDLDFANSVFLHNIDFLKFPFKLTGLLNSAKLIYFDPPYLHSTRKDSNLYGKCYELSDNDHIRLLEMILNFNDCGFLIMVSHYANKLYDEALKDFNYFDFRSTTRHGISIERLYYNYDYPIFNKHEYTYAGNIISERPFNSSLFSSSVLLVSLKPTSSMISLPVTASTASSVPPAISPLPMLAITFLSLPRC